MQYIDLSHRITNNMPVYPGDPCVSLLFNKKISSDGYNAYSLKTNLHAGTHLDFPMHLLDYNTAASEYPLDLFCGRGFLIDASYKALQEKQYLIQYESAFDEIQKGDIALIYTGFDKLYGKKNYYTEHPVVSKNLADFLVEKGIKLIGLDCPSPDYYPYSVHKKLLSSNICIIENLTNLKKLTGVKNFEVFAVPLKISAEASLIRAYARY